jgi:hypothetical protein
MDNYIELIIYLLIIVGSGIIQAFRNKKKKEQESQNIPPPPQRRVRREVSSPEADTTTRRPGSFEDILRELMGDPRETQPAPEPEPEPEPYRPPVRREKTRRESEAYQSASGTYRNAVDEAGKAEKLNDRIDLENLDEFIQPRRMRVNKPKTSRFAREVRAMLQNPESARKAIILSEILNRKHF